MPRKKSLSATDLMQELHSGAVTTKFILKRFRRWLPYERIDGHHHYSRNLIPVLIKILESLNAGMLPSEIDEELKNPEQTNSTPLINPLFMDQPNTGIQVGKEGLRLIESLFNDFEIQQKRIAAAQEKRAETEEKKARAMNNIAAALREMNRHLSHDSQTRENALLKSQAPAENDTPSKIPRSDGTKATSLESEGKRDNSQSQPLEAADQVETADAIDVDDLSVLIDDAEPIKRPQEVDDLWLLIESPTPEPQPPVEIDDLSLLIEPDAQAPMDDLSALIDETPSLKPDITPKEDLKEYKAAVMKTIFRLKTEGLSAEESTDRLNQDGVQTISGKSKWSEKAISQIYKFIDSAE